MSVAPGSGIHARGSGRPLAVAAVVGVVATLGYMYVAGKQTKREEGPASMYKDPKGRDTAATSDAKLSSSDVQAVVHGKMKP